MYNRAINRLKHSINQKGVKEEDVKATSYGLYHFHIDTFNDNIQMNRFEAINNKHNTIFN